jgi:hypothetical protein
VVADSRVCLRLVCCLWMLMQIRSVRYSMTKGRIARSLMRAWTRGVHKTVAGTLAVLVAHGVRASCDRGCCLQRSKGEMHTTQLPKTLAASTAQG